MKSQVLDKGFIEVVDSLGNDSNNSELDADGNEIGTPDIC